MKTLFAILTGVAIGTVTALWMATRPVVEPGEIEVASAGPGPFASQGAPDDE